uniref:Uncharacterized protein n=1 Tax=Janibacter limosus TaxID=53458 RepID=A0AC61U6Z5_9MICO|nr:hypothetical protein [Janibacter limosus]
MVATGVASAEEVEQARADNKLARVLYHDWEAQTYDEKWSISFDDRCTTVVRDRFLRVLESTRRPGESLPARQDPRARRRDRVLLAQPQAGRPRRRAARLRPVPGHGRGGEGERPPARLRDRGPGR